MDKDMNAMLKVLLFLVLHMGRSADTKSLSNDTKYAKEIHA